MAYLELGEIVIGEGSSVRGHRHVAVELGQPGLADIGTVLPQVLLTQVELQPDNRNTQTRQRLELKANDISFPMLLHSSSRGHYVQV